MWVRSMQQLSWYINDGLCIYGKKYIYIENMAILNKKGVDYICAIWNTSKSYAK